MRRPRPPRPSGRAVGWAGLGLLLGALGGWVAGLLRPPPAAPPGGGAR